MKKCYTLVLMVLLCKFSSARPNLVAYELFGKLLSSVNYINKYITPGINDGVVGSNVTITPEGINYNKYGRDIFGNYSKQMEAQVPGTGVEYDVKYYRLELRINPDTAVGNYVKGKVTTYFKTTQANFSQINFDMANALNCDSVYYHGVKVTAGNINRVTADLIKITIPNIPAIGTLDSVSIYYKGAPPAVPGMAGTGYVTATHSSGPVRNYVYTLSEPYSSYTWWPCKSFIVNDKADSMDMFVSTPLNFKAAGNGTLVYETTSGSNILTYWKERYPISAYQVCVAVANYVQYPTVADTVTLSGIKMPVYNYIFPETNTPAAHTSLDRVSLMITTYSNLFGDYPFKNEKYGNYSFGFGGGMEHNTFSGESTSGVYTAAGNWDVLAHELAHQWWGDNATCGSWHDIWLNESFADYSEALLLEFAPSIATSVGKTAVSWRNTKKNTNSLNASYQAKTTYVTDTADILTIFTPSVYIYDRGGMIITMLRKILGDAKFFQGLKNYQSDPLVKTGNGLTADIKRNLENASGLNLTTFFSQWLYNTGYAKYAGSQWNNSGTNIVLKLPQTIQSSSVTHFDMPVVVRIQGSVPATMDTTVVVYDQGGILYYDNNGTLTSTGTNLINYHLSFNPVTITFDAFNETLASGAFAKNTGLPVTLLATQVITFNAVKQGNTAKLSWTVDNTLDYNSFEIERSADGISFQNIGTIKSADFPDKYNFTFTDYNILSGNGYYRINIKEKNGTSFYTKTVVINNKAINDIITISPNPASRYIVIASSALVKEVVDIKIYDAAGRQVKEILKQSLSSNNNQQISVEDLGIGNYFVEIVGSNSGKITKQISVIR
jgi:aminopeptidase N